MEFDFRANCWYCGAELTNHRDVRVRVDNDFETVYRVKCPVCSLRYKIHVAK